jgi:hypothetical protein
VRTLAYSPQDNELQQCMNGVLQGLEFPGFGRGIAERTFQQAISTVRAQTRPTGTPGFGTPANSAVVVPWFLVSSPSLDAAHGQLVPLATVEAAGTPATTGNGHGASTSGTGTTTAGASSGTSSGTTTAHGAQGTQGAQGAQGAQGTQGTTPTRPWWEEQQ